MSIKQEISLATCLTVGFVNSGYQVCAELQRLLSALDGRYPADRLLYQSMELALLQMESARRHWTLRRGDPTLCSSYFLMLAKELDKQGIDIYLSNGHGSVLEEVQSYATAIATTTHRFQDPVLSKHATSPIDVFGATCSILCFQHAAFLRVFQISRDTGKVMEMEAQYLGCLAATSRVIKQRRGVC